MPGTILVSVLGLMDLPPSGQASSTSSSEGRVGGLVSLKIAMGKTEFETTDTGDFSFPLTSLRENLKLTLLDADGNEISQTDVQTIVVVEKRIWDALFPLEGGGWVHLKLQFILNAEEHKRIREMREAVLKRRRGELLKSDFKDSVAGLNVIENIIGSSANFTTEEGHLADELPAKSEDGKRKLLVASLSQDPPQHPEHNHEQDAIHQSKANEEASGYQVTQNDIHEINVSLEETTDPQLRCSVTLVSEEIMATSSSSAMAHQERKDGTGKEPVHEKFPVSDTKKLVSAFESMSVQEPRIHVGPTAESWMRWIKRGDSLGVPRLEEMNNEKVTIQKMMPKSFSTGALPQMKSAPFGLPYAEVQEEEKHTELPISKKSLGNNKQSIESTNVQNYEKPDPGNKKAVSEFLCAAESPSFERASGTTEIINTKEVVNFCTPADIIKNVDQYPSHEAKAGPPVAFQLRLRKHEAFEEKIGLGSFPEGVSFLDSKSSYGNSDVTASHSFEKEGNILGCKDRLLHRINKGNDKMVEGPSVCGEYPGGYLESFDGRELVHTKEIRKHEEASTKDSMIPREVLAKPGITKQSSSSSMHQRQPKPSIVKAERGLSSTRDDVYELSTCGSSDVELDLLTYFDAEQCLLGSHGDSMPRHLCITSGSKQLKDVIGGFISI